MDSDNPNWNPGKLLFYGRAELKQSDHRPVVAILDIEYSLIDIDKRARVFNEVIQDLGPPDATVVIQAFDEHNDEDEDSIYDENVTAALVQELAQIGEVTLIRFVGETMWVTFKHGQAALACVEQKGNIQVCGINLSIKLKTNDWVKHVEHEIALCTTNCVNLCEYIDVSASSDYNSLGIPLAPSEKKKPPGRPALPKSPQVTPKHHPRHQVCETEIPCDLFLKFASFYRLVSSMLMISFVPLNRNLNYRNDHVYRLGRKQWSREPNRFHLYLNIRPLHRKTNRIKPHQLFTRRFKKTS